MNIDWGAIRREFPVTERCIYLNTGWSGPQSHSVVRALEQRAEREAFDGPTMIDVRHEKALLVQAARRAFASMIDRSWSLVIPAIGAGPKCSVRDGSDANR